MLARMSTILGLIWQHNNPTKTSSQPWGGMNIIISRDFHQFKLVVQKKSAPLYWPVNTMQDNEEEVMGSELYGQFKTVVCLMQQMWVQDEEWMDFLQYCHHGQCQPRHLSMLRNLLVTSHRSVRVDASIPPWSNAVLITSCHAVQAQWNELAL